MAREPYGAYGAPSEWNHQRVVNVEWPPEGIPSMLPEQPPVPVRVRVVWEHDGEEWIAGRAVRWLRPVVFVLINDARHRGAGLWLPLKDIRRSPSGRSPSGSGPKEWGG